MSHTVSQPTNQPTNQPINQPTDLSINQWACISINPFIMFIHYFPWVFLSCTLCPQLISRYILTWPDLWVVPVSACIREMSVGSKVCYRLPPTNTNLISLHAPFCTRSVHISVTKWCIVGYLSNALWHLWDESISSLSVYCLLNCLISVSLVIMSWRRRHHYMEMV